MSQYLQNSTKGTIANLDSNFANNPVKNTIRATGPNNWNNSDNFYGDKYVLNDDDKRKIKTIEQCIITCVSASSLPDRMYNKISGKSTKEYRNMLIRRALLNVLKKQKEEGGLGSVSASKTFVDNSKQLFSVGYAGLTNMGRSLKNSVNSFSRTGSGGEKNRKSKKTRKPNKSKKSRKNRK